MRTDPHEGVPSDDEGDDLPSDDDGEEDASNDDEDKGIAQCPSPSDIYDYYGDQNEENAADISFRSHPRSNTGTCYTLYACTA